VRRQQAGETGIVPVPNRCHVGDNYGHAWLPGRSHEIADVSTRLACDSRRDVNHHPVAAICPPALGSTRHGYQLRRLGGGPKQTHLWLRPAVRSAWGRNARDGLISTTRARGRCFAATAGVGYRIAAPLD
jgi:hypothetical protein